MTSECVLRVRIADTHVVGRSFVTVRNHNQRCDLFLLKATLYKCRDSLTGSAMIGRRMQGTARCGISTSGVSFGWGTTCCFSGRELRNCFWASFIN